MARSSLLTFALVASLALAGCTPSTEPVAEPDATVVTPTPTPTQARETGLVPPARVFGGECDALFSDAELSTILGVDLGHFDEPRSPTYFTQLLTEQLGGMTCGWGNRDGNDYVSITVAPAGAVGPTVPTTCSSAGGPGTGCTMDVTTNGTRLVGYVFLDDQDQDADKAHSFSAALEVSALFSTKAEASEAVPAPIPAQGAWRNPADCVAVDAAITSSAFLNGAPRTPVLQFGGSGGYLSPIDEAARGYDPEHPHFFCSWKTNDSNSETRVTGNNHLSIMVLGGGAWIGDEIAAMDGSTELTISGVKRAYSVTTGDGSIVVIDGPNALYITPQLYEPKKAYSSIPLIIDALDSLS